MDSREHLQSMLTNLINGDEKAASTSIHQYIVAKARDIANAPKVVHELDELDDDE